MLFFALLVSTFNFSKVADLLETFNVYYFVPRAPVQDETSGTPVFEETVWSDCVVSLCEVKCICVCYDTAVLCCSS